MPTIKCPDCQRQALVKRGANLLKNIRKRKNTNRYDDWYCEACGKTFPDEMIDTDLIKERQIAQEATEW